MPWLAELAVANAFMVIEVGPIRSNTDNAITAVNGAKIFFLLFILY